MKPWTKEEKDLIAEHYPQTGTVKLRDLLPARTAAGIRIVAYSLGLHCILSKRNTKAKTWTTEEDAIIAKNYYRIRMKTDPMDIETLAKKVGATPLQVRYRATFLGLLRQAKKQPDWTEAEDEFLASHAHKSVRWIQQALVRHGFSKRTETGIVTRRKRLGVTVVGNGTAYSAGEFGRLMGTNPKTVSQWIKRGLLEARPRTESVDPIHGGVGDRWEITQHAARQFVFKHTAYVDLGAVDKYWFVGLMEPAHQPRPFLAQSTCGFADESRP